MLVARLAGPARNEAAPSSSCADPFVVAAGRCGSDDIRCRLPPSTLAMQQADVVSDGPALQMDFTSGVAEISKDMKGSSSHLARKIHHNKRRKSSSATQGHHAQMNQARQSQWFYPQDTPCALLGKMLG